MQEVIRLVFREIRRNKLYYKNIIRLQRKKTKKNKIIYFSGNKLKLLINYSTY